MCPQKILDCQDREDLSGHGNNSLHLLLNTCACESAPKCLQWQRTLICKLWVTLNGKIFPTLYFCCCQPLFPALLWGHKSECVSFPQQSPTGVHPCTLLPPAAPLPPPHTNYFLAFPHPSRALGSSLHCPPLPLCWPTTLLWNRPVDDALWLFAESYTLGWGWKEGCRGAVGFMGWSWSREDSKRVICFSNLDLELPPLT